MSLEAVNVMSTLLQARLGMMPFWNELKPRYLFRYADHVSLAVKVRAITNSTDHGNRAKNPLKLHDERTAVKIISQQMSHCLLSS